MIYPASFYKSKKLLLIEDCEPVRASIKGMLQQIGFEDITTVSHIVQAMPLVKLDNLKMSQSFSQIPADKALLPLAKAMLTALEFSTKTAANQQRLAQLLPQLPQLYLD